MSIKEFVDDFKTMVKTKDTKLFNEKYVEPAMKWTKETAVSTKETVDKYTPIIVESTKKAWNKGYDTFQQMNKKAEQQEQQEKQKQAMNENQETKVQDTEMRSTAGSKTSTMNKDEINDEGDTKNKP